MTLNNTYSDNLRLLFADADILMYEIKIEDVDFSSDKEMFYLSVIIQQSQNTMLIQTN